MKNKQSMRGKLAIKKIIGKLLPSASGAANGMVAADKEEYDVYIVSFPKCGRTWLRMMLGKAIVEHFDLDEANMLELPKLAAACPQLPRIRFTHDDDPHRKTPAELKDDKSKYAGKKIVFLVRDPRDTLVSSYFQKTKRDGEFSGDLSAYLRDEHGSTASLMRWLGIWAQQRKVAGDFLLVSYEELHTQPEVQLRRVLDFVGLSEIPDDAIQLAVEFSRFDNMRRMESEGAVGSHRLKPGDANDAESFKTRKGKVGGYVEYMNVEDIQYVNEMMRSRLPDFYGYR